ncbi:DUF4410 domain-containing protein [Rhodopseudomonas palustris]|uniref:DUF4410 domain-containing protein n=1 Tax=Rhodopseudomonas palustris TaxID=1076 RepID=UPI00142F1D13
MIVENESSPPKKPSRREKQLADAQMASAVLSESLPKLLASRRLIVVAGGQPSDLTLRCRILDARSGSKALRVFVGYGAGKAVLRVAVSLNDPRMPDRPPLLDFETEASSGSMPGGATNAVALAGVGLNLLKQDGLPDEIEQTTKTIDERLGQYFLAQNWPYPKPSLPATTSSDR